MWRFVVPAAGTIAGLVMALSIALRDAPSSVPQPAPLAPAQAPADAVISAPAPTTTAVTAQAQDQRPPLGVASVPVPRMRADTPEPPTASPSVIAGGDLPLDSETAVLRRQRDALAAEVQRLQTELDRDQRSSPGIRKQDVLAVRPNSVRARRREEVTRARDANDPGFASVEGLLARLRRGSGAGSAPGPASTAPQMTQPTAADPTAAWERLTAARHALAMGSFDEARMLLQAARIQLALRPITPDQPEPIPDGRGAAQQVGAALSNLDAGRQMQAIRGVDQAIARLTGIPDESIERGAALPASAYAGWPSARPIFGQQVQP